MSRTLAFGDDHSSGADTAWEWIAGHQWPGWSIEIVTAEAPADMHPVEAEAAELHPWEPDDPRDAVGPGFDSFSHLRADVDPRVALISKPWDLVVVGPRGSGMLKSLHLGSTADWLLRQPVSPLLIARQSRTVRKVLVATDGSDHSERSMRTLVSLPWIGEVSVQVMTVADRKVDAESALSVATGILSDGGADVANTVAREGRPTQAIITEIDDTDPDLIVMGARGRGGIKRLVVGSTTAAIAGSVDRSLLVAHAEEESG